MLIDTHCHMDMLINKAGDRPFSQEDYQTALNIIKDASIENVLKIINVGTTLFESQYCISLAEQFEACYAAIGIHPNDVKINWEFEIKELSKYLDKKESASKIVAIGEIGLDFHYPGYNFNLQRDSFIAQIELALNHNLPIIVHSRDAEQETLELLSLYKKDKLTGSIHCFSYGPDFAKEVINMGFVLGIGGTVTYPKNGILRSAVIESGLKNIVLETDAPFLAPQVIRGKTNYPASVALIAQYLSELLRVDYKTICEETTINANKIFNLK